MRANCASYPNYVSTIVNIISNLPSGYNRDFQLTKEPFIRGVKSCIDTISIATIVLENLKVNKKSIEEACSPELYATEEAYSLVKEKNIPFRDAYKIVAEKYKK